ncbi:MAG: hypothetical protein CMC13_12575 [Flavobacteriaceae bacterium]|nr:hypothetical protein [Flavobacteriaceae bacterium]
MTSNTFNICRTCIHRDSCVITHNKSQVWSCSEYEVEEKATETKKPLNINNVKKEAPEMAMA